MLLEKLGLCSEWPRSCYLKIADTQLPPRGAAKVTHLRQFDGVTLNRCLAACAKTGNCRSAIYVDARELCRLYDTTSGESGTYDCEGVDLYEIERPCDLLVEQEIPCPNEESPAFLKRSGTSLDNVEDAVSLRVGLEDCRLFCESNEDDEGVAFPCAAFTFQSRSVIISIYIILLLVQSQLGFLCSTEQCILYPDGLAPFGENLPVASGGVDLYQKLCLNGTYEGRGRYARVRR